MLHSSGVIRRRVSQQCKVCVENTEVCEVCSNREGQSAIGYQLELRRASSECPNYGQIFIIWTLYSAAKYNRYVITDPLVFKTTAIDHSAIPQRRKSGHNLPDFGSPDFGVDCA